MTAGMLDAAWAQWYDCYFGTYDEDLDFFFEEAGKARGHVLEAGCGTGRLTLALLERGVEVVGFDPLPAMLERLRARARRAGLKPQVSVQSMETFKYGERFDLIIAPFRVFNHCLTPASQRGALENFRRHLAPEGRLILATFVPDPELITSATNTIQYMSTVTHPDTGLPVICSHFNAETDLLNQRLTDVWVYEELDGERVARKAYLPITIRWIHPSEMGLLLQLAGFNQFEVYGGFGREPLGPDCHEQIWIARCAEA